MQEELNRDHTALRRGRRARILVAALLCILVWVIYGQSRDYGRAIDDHLIFETMQRIPAGWDGFDDIIRSRYNISEYRPVTMASFQLERMLFGSLRSGRAHLVNVLLYMATIWLVVFCAWRLGALVFPDSRINGRLLLFTIAAAGIFASHPIHANVVSSIKNRDTILSCMFVAASLYMLLGMIGGKADRRRSALRFALFALFYLLAYYSKRDAIGLLLAGPLTVLVFRPGKWKLAVGTFLACILVNTTYFWAKTYIAVAPESADVIDIIQYSENPMGNGFGERLAALFSTALLYIKLFLYPKGYYFYFGYDVFRFPFRGGLLALAVITTSGIAAWGIIAAVSKQRNLLIAFGILFTASFLVYCLNYIDPVAGIIAPRLAYIASFGFCILLAALLLLIRHQAAGYILAAAITVVFAVFARQRSLAWKDFETLVRSDIPHLADSHEANRIAGEVFTLTADTLKDRTRSNQYYRLAVQHLDRANRIYDQGWKALYYEGYARYTLGDVSGATTRLQQSMDHNPQFNPFIAEMLGDAYFFGNQLNRARTVYQSIWENDRSRQYILNKIFNTYYQQNDVISLMILSDSLINADPGLYPPYENLGYIFLQEKDTARAVNYFRKAISNGLEDPNVEAIVNRNGR